MMDNKFIVVPKEKQAITITITIRISETLNTRIEDLALKSGHSRNAIVNKALDYALAHMEFMKDTEER